MPKVAGTYRAVVREKRLIFETKAESKQEAIRLTLLAISKLDDRECFEAWVNGGMEIELSAS